MEKLLCQSCGMQMEKLGDFGTDKEGKQKMDYCRNCFQGGFFTNPHTTMEEQIDRMVSREMSHENISEHDARKKYTILMPTLDRWKDMSQPASALDQKKNLKVMISTGIAVLLFAIVMYIFTGEGGNDTDGFIGDQDSNASFIAIGVAVFVSIISNKRKKPKRNLTAAQQRKFFIAFTAGILLLILFVIFFSLKK